MLRLLAHRGPDGEGVIETPGACLGHRRLAIIDLSEAGGQPFANEDRTVWACVNGEIYNHKALRRDLEGCGHLFRGRCDCEVVAHLYEEHGLEMTAKLEGMFALAVWDARGRRLLLARDRLGKKPLYYYSNETGRLAFASEVAALLAAPWVPNEPDHLALHHYLAFGFVPAPLTAFRGIRKLAASEVLVWQDGRCSARRTWAPPPPPEPGGAHRWDREREAEAASALRRALGEAVRKRLESDVPLGLLLSGGLDSSVLAVEMARALPGGFSTFSVGFPDADYDESSWAERVARHVGSKHHAIRVLPDAVSSLPRLVERYGEPFADSSAVAVEALARAVRPHVKVVLGGDGADELFGGYDRYRAIAISERMNTGPAAPLLRPAGRVLRVAAGALSRAGSGMQGRRNLSGRLWRFAGGLGRAGLERNEEWIAFFTDGMRRALCSEKLLADLGDEDPMDALRRRYPSSGGVLERVMHADLVFGLPDRMLVKLDGATMSVGLEARCPFLDRPLVEWAARLPARMKVGWKQGKPLLRRAYRDALPAEILGRRKAGFGLPVDRWLRGPLREMASDLLSRESVAGRGLFRPKEVSGMLREHDIGARNHDDRIWALLCLELWFRSFVDARPGDGSGS